MLVRSNMIGIQNAPRTRPEPNALPLIAAPPHHDEPEWNTVLRRRHGTRRVVGDTPPRDPSNRPNGTSVASGRQSIGYSLCAHRVYQRPLLREYRGSGVGNRESGIGSRESAPAHRTRGPWPDSRRCLAGWGTRNAPTRNTQRGRRPLSSQPRWRRKLVMDDCSGHPPAPIDSQASADSGDELQQV